MLFGLACLYIEFTHPGLVLPGVPGLVRLVLFAFAVQMLPFSVLGLLLILTGVALFVLEVKVTSYGALTVGGLVCVVIGALMLFPGPIPELRLPLAAILPTSLSVALIMAFLTHRSIRAQMWKVTTGREGLAGEAGTAVTAIGLEGKVFVHGEYWNAASEVPIAAGAKVRVRAVKDMVLEVERADAAR